MDLGFPPLETKNLSESDSLVRGLAAQVMNTLRAERAVDLYRYKGAICIKDRGSTEVIGTS